MEILKKNYKIDNNAPKEIEWEKYYSESMEEYNILLQTQGEPEKTFQQFFEKNPAFMPGALGFEFSSHYPYMDTLISQPEIGIEIKRKPDFLWLAQNSLEFTPIFIEIESPNKKMFTRSGLPNGEFNQALNQIDEWRGLLNDSDVIRNFYKGFSIPSELQSKIFKPKFILIYGRRNEYDNNDYLRRIRSQKQRDNVVIMSFNRLHAMSGYQQFTCSEVSRGKYNILHIPPTFRYRADRVEILAKYENFEKAIDSMEKTSSERKEFLHKRFSYWIANEKSIMKGMLISGEGE